MFDFLLLHCSSFLVSTGAFDISVELHLQRVGLGLGWLLLCSVCALILWEEPSKESMVSAPLFLLRFLPGAASFLAIVFSPLSRLHLIPGTL